jgi:hypothetical protein
MRSQLGEVMRARDQVSLPSLLGRKERSIMRTQRLIKVGFIALVISLIYVGTVPSQQGFVSSSQTGLVPSSDVVVQTEPSGPFMLVSGKGFKFGIGIYPGGRYGYGPYFGGGYPYDDDYGQYDHDGYYRKCWWTGYQKICKWYPRDDWDD